MSSGHFVQHEFSWTLRICGLPFELQTRRSTSERPTAARVNAQDAQQHSYPSWIEHGISPDQTEIDEVGEDFLLYVEAMR
jgi:hypothetical protein